MKDTITADGGSLTTAQIRAVKEEVARRRRPKREKTTSRQARSKSVAVHEYRVKAIADYKAPTNYPPTTTAVTFDPTLPAMNKSKRGSECKTFPPDVREQYKKSGMWFSSKERRQYERDMRSYIVVSDYKREVARGTTKVIVPRRKFLGQKPTQSKDRSAIDEALDLTPAELKRVREFDWTTVEKGAKPKQGHSPPPVITNNRFTGATEEESVVEASAGGGYDILDAPSSTVLDEKVTPAEEKTTTLRSKGDAHKCKQQSKRALRLETSRSAAVAAINRADAQRRSQENKRALKAAREVKRQRDIKQQAETAAAQRAKRVAQHLKRNEDGK